MQPIRYNKPIAGIYINKRRIQREGREEKILQMKDVEARDVSIARIRQRPQKWKPRVKLGLSDTDIETNTDVAGLPM